MTREKYEERLRVLEEQLRADIALLNAAHETRLRSLAKLWQDAVKREQDGGAPEASSRRLPGTPPPPRPPPWLRLRPRSRRSSASCPQRSRRGLPRPPRVFDRRDIIRALGYTPARATLARALAMLREEGLITTDM